SYENVEISNTSKNKGKSIVTEGTFTTLNKIDPMLDDIKIQGRCISLWHSHPTGKPKDAYSLDFVFQDQKGNRIQCTIKSNDMHKIEPLLQEGDCYQISEFSVGENNGKLPLLNHIFKITFFRSTLVTRIDPMFLVSRLNHLMILSKKYHETDSVDIIGTGVAFGDVVVVPNLLLKKERRNPDPDLRILRFYDTAKQKRSRSYVGSLHA
ncbi:replication protein A 70 kDa DNA-binding subunit B, partial [Tanacetum coccineum]